MVRNEIYLILGIIFLLIVFTYSASAFKINLVGEDWVVEKTQSEPLTLPQSSSEVSYVYANGKRIASISDEVRFYHNDYLGSTRVTTNSDGEKESSLDYYPFGAVLKSDGLADFYKFAGKELDSTGLQYFGARYYDYGTGRFMQVDPLTNPLVNPYYYAAANPMRFVDPDGREIKVITNPYYNNVMSHEQQADVLVNLYSNFMSSPLVTGKYASKLKEIDGFKKDVIITSLYIDPENPLLENAYLAYAITPSDDDEDIYITIDLETLEILQNMGLYKDTDALIAHELLGHIGDYVKNPEKYSQMTREKRENSAERVEKEFAGSLHRFTTPEQERQFFLEKSLRAIGREMQSQQDSVYNSILKSWSVRADSSKTGPLPSPE